MQTRGVEGGKGHRAFCEVAGYVAPNTSFLLRLPLEQWNGKLIELGCGGFCGSTEHIRNCDAPLGRGYACIVSDGGHRSSISDSAWAFQNLPAMIEYLVRSSHVTALAGKAIAQRYYGKEPKPSYFMGCSAGGEQAMMEAQRFPADFDGIIAGQPTSEAAADMNLLWNNRVLTGKGGTPVLTEPDIELLHRAVLARCDRNDGIQDGIIGDPLDCHFDPKVLECHGGDHNACLTTTQVEAVQRLYRGPVTSSGRAVSLPGALPGSERMWPIYQERLAYQVAGEAFRYWDFQPAPGLTWKPEDFDFDRDPQRLGFVEGLISPTNPDLRGFKARGGKLIAYAGWNDVVGMPLSSVDYYEMAEKTMGGRAATQSFFRLFMIPGMNHCNGGEGAYAVDYLSALEAWVEHGQAPEKLLSAHPKLEALWEKAERGDQEAMQEITCQLSFPLDPAHVAFTRPVYPYPLKARYRGRGDPNDAANHGPGRQ